MEESIFNISKAEENKQSELKSSESSQNNDKDASLLPIDDSIVNANLTDSNNLLGNTNSLDIVLGNDKLDEKKKGGMFSFFSKKNKEPLAVKEPINKSKLDNETNTDNSIIGDNADKSNDIFGDLDLGTLNFLDESNNQVQKKQFNIFIFLKKISGLLVGLLLISNIGLGLNYILLSTDNELFRSVPGLCDYIGSKVNGYDNSTTCFSINKIKDDLTGKYNTLEQAIYAGLKIFIPKKIKTDYITTSPEVSFIQSKHPEDKIYIYKMFEEFEQIRSTSGLLKGTYDIECDGYRVDETGIFETSCTCYGGSIWDTPNGQDVITSRTVALNFLKKLTSQGSHFTLMEYPKSLSMGEYNGTEGIKTQYTSQTGLNLRLKYSLSSKM